MVPPVISLTFLVTIGDLSADTLLEVLLGGFNFTKPTENKLKSIIKTDNLSTINEPTWLGEGMYGPATAEGLAALNMASV